MSSCTNPLLAVRLYGPGIGKQSIKILPRREGQSIEEVYARYGQDNILELPCGRCPACISNKKKEWAVRCCLEAAAHKDNCFVTLTYADEFYDDLAHREHLREFFKSLYRKDIKFRYYGCSERGDELGRIHYHLIMFGFFPSDAKPWMKSKSGFMQYRSKLLDSCWTYGLVVVSEFSPAEASYVTGYVNKKMISKDPEMFHFQSTRPGIGQSYVLKHAQDIYETDNLVLNFGSHRYGVPRYFDKVVQSYYSMDLSDIKKKRLELASIQSNQMQQDYGLDCRFKLLSYLESINKDKFHVKKRRF